MFKNHSVIQLIKLYIHNCYFPSARAGNLVASYVICRKRAGGNHYRIGALVLCDTHDTSILIVDTYVTIPVSPRSRYTVAIPWDGASIASIDDTVQLVPLARCKPVMLKRTVKSQKSTITTVQRRLLIFYVHLSPSVLGLFFMRPSSVLSYPNF